jgi:serine/threonine protein kinase
MAREWIDDQGIRAARNFLIFTLHFSFAIPKLQIGISLPFNCLATSFRLGPSYFYRRVRLLRSSLGAARSLCATIEPRRKPMIATCPTSDRLQDYVLGKLPEQESDELYGHLAGCDCCQQKLEASDSQNDSFVGQFKIDGESESFHQEPAFWQATDRAKDIAGLLSRRVLGDVEISGLEGLANSHGPETFPPFIGEYQVDRVLGRGGMGTVYLGHHTKLDRAVALKVISRHRLADPKTQGRFASEMKAVGRMNHPNIVAAHDAREVDGTAVLVTEYIDGLNVGSIIRRVGPLTVADATRIACDVAAALGAINDAGLIHRDIKPSNIMVSRAGQVKLLDLGLARLQDTNGELQEHTATGQALGTVDYIAPEQINEGRDVDVRADIYALGCTLFRMLTGQPVFDDVRYATAFAKMTAQVQAKPPSVGDIADNIPAPLVGLVAEMLQKDPAQRPQTPQALVERLEPFTMGAKLSALVEQASTCEEKPRTAARSVSTSAAHRTSPQRGSFWSGRFFFLVGSGFGGVFLGLAMAWLMGIEITIKHADGTTTKLKVASGSIVTIDEHGNATVELSPPLAKSNSVVNSTDATKQVPLAANDSAWQKTSAQRTELLQALADSTNSKLHPLAGIWSIRNDHVTHATFLILGREQYSAYHVIEGEYSKGLWQTNDSVQPPHFDIETALNQAGNSVTRQILRGVYQRIRSPGSNSDLLTVNLAHPRHVDQRPKLGDVNSSQLELERVDLSKLESLADTEATDEMFRILEKLIAEPTPDSIKRSNAAVELIPLDANLADSNSSADSAVAEPSVPAVNLRFPSEPASRRDLAERRNETVRAKGYSPLQGLHPLTGVWREFGKADSYLILGREQFAFFRLKSGLEYQGSWRTDDNASTPNLDLEISANLSEVSRWNVDEEFKRTRLGVYQRYPRSATSFYERLTIVFSNSDEFRPSLLHNGEGVERLDLGRANHSVINDIELPEAREEVFRIWTELTAVGQPRSDTSTSKQEPTDTISLPMADASVLRAGAMPGLSGPPTADQEIKANEIRQLNGVWRFENESRFQGAFLFLMNDKFAIVGGTLEKPSPSEDRGQEQAPGLVEFVGSVAFDPTTDPPQFDFEFLGSRFLNPSGVPKDPMLGICQIIGHKEIRRKEKQADDSATSTTFAYPYENVELKIWFAQPGKPRPTSKTTGNGVEQLQLVRIDMSETINEQELNNEIPTEVRTRWNAISDQSAKK